MSKHLSIEGKIWKPVNCDHCSTEFVYKMSRKAGAMCDDVEDTEQKKEALTFAKQGLKEKFNSEFDQIPCPNCGKFQPNMLWVHRHKKFTFLEGASYSFALFAALLSLMGVLLKLAISPQGEMQIDTLLFIDEFLLYIVLVVPTLLTVALICRLFRLLVNPNRKPKFEEAVKMVNEGTILDKNQFKAAVKDMGATPNTAMLLGASAVLAYSAYQIFAPDSSASAATVDDTSMAEPEMASEPDVAEQTAEVDGASSPEESVTFDNDNLTADQVDSVEGEEAVDIASIDAVDTKTETAFANLDSQLNDDLDIAMEDIEFEVDDGGDLLDDFIDNA